MNYFGFRNLLWLLVFLCGVAPARAFTLLVPIPAPRITGGSPAFSEDRYKIENLLDENSGTEYASKNEGTNTTVEFDFGRPTLIAAVWHQDRNDPALVAASELDLYGSDGHLVSSNEIQHVRKRGGETFFVLRAPVLAQKATWRVTKLGNPAFQAVGGAGLRFFTPGESDSIPRQDRIEITASPCVDYEGKQPFSIHIRHPYAQPAAVLLRISGAEAHHVNLHPGLNEISCKIPAVEAPAAGKADLKFGDQLAASQEFQRKPVRPLTVYVLPHSHTDIGYTEIQSAVEKKQMRNIDAGIAAAQRTADYPEGSRFVWNVEVLWAADMYLHHMNDAQRAGFIAAVKRGQIALNGMYANELTGLCRPEELIQLFRCATKISKLTGKPIDSAMISDVPGYTWGTVTALAQAGIKYLSAAPNYFDRMGTILRDCENKPFYWVGPDGTSKVLAWIPFRGYAMSHIYGSLSPKLVGDLCDELDRTHFPYDIVYVRWAGHGDNATPDPAICDFIKKWNAKYRWPRFIISGTTEAFRAFEQRYGAQIPVERGDWTPYWEDGAGSSARETAMNRANADRLTQAEALWAMLDPKHYPVEDFDSSWRNVLLYSEHTWGAYCSVSDPENQKTIEQWAVKRSYVEDGAEQSRALIEKALADQSTEPAAPASAGDFDVFNTTSWTRTGLVFIAAEQSENGNKVVDERGRTVPSQRLKDGQLAFLAKDVPPLATRRYRIQSGSTDAACNAKATATSLDNGILHIGVDPTTGDIIELRKAGAPENFAQASGSHGVNEYLFLPGDRLADLKRNGPVKISIQETGPLVASLLIQSDAPGCRSLIREVRLTSGADYVELVDTLDKLPAAAPPHPPDWEFAQKGGKESVHFAFPFNVPDGQMVINAPLSEMRPDVDQIPGSCKNWFSVSRWADVSNRKSGVTWVPLDSPLIEVGDITARLLGSQTNPEVWRKHVGPAQKLYAWVMNNHWETNYRASQEGRTVFRFFLRPHGPLNPADAARLAIGQSQPLIAVPARSGREHNRPLFNLDSKGVLVMGIKPSDDHRALIIRLFNESGREESARLKWGAFKPASLWLSGTSEDAIKDTGNKVQVPGYGLLTLRAELP